MQVNNALNTQNGLNTKSLYNLPLNSKVLIYREVSKQKGLYKLISITSKTYRVELPSSSTNFRATIIKLYYKEKENTEEDTSKEQEQEKEQELLIQRL